ncbi:hypothetical protein PHLGIDRAFT_298966 [Phlebiopsis gigantea 11061_1 CR5-6]|uniref:Uncharacterized protein n=1 Tax=Phlebiopsis gigantea (strain 11061_1 CR5-6) TaxID=745531 RepID=A0A0C3NCU0_PHLG1|nr:hypothetical protein PHLGIDRAFT_298966 [Phlebiopsis gigantea 11061_1 CR5-6]
MSKQSVPCCAVFHLLTGSNASESVMLLHEQRASLQREISHVCTSAKMEHQRCSSFSNLRGNGRSKQNSDSRISRSTHSMGRCRTTLRTSW